MIALAMRTRSIRSSGSGFENETVNKCGLAIFLVFSKFVVVLFARYARLSVQRLFSRRTRLHI